MLRHEAVVAATVVAVVMVVMLLVMLAALVALVFVEVISVPRLCEGCAASGCALRAGPVPASQTVAASTAAITAGCGVSGIGHCSAGASALPNRTGHGRPRDGHAKAPFYRIRFLQWLHCSTTIASLASLFGLIIREAEDGLRNRVKIIDSQA